MRIRGLSEKYVIERLEKLEEDNKLMLEYINRYHSCFSKAVAFDFLCEQLNFRYDFDRNIIFDKNIGTQIINCSKFSEREDIRHAFIANIEGDEQWK